jgi:membrane protein YdbS with pleckstrin-like domain
MHNALSDEQIMKLERPDPALWRLYIVRAILGLPAIFISLPYLFFRYHTLRYRFDAEGIHMKVGILFRREVNLTYARIQDIHLRSGFIQRWLGLADLQVQTASGSTGPEIVIEGFKEFEAIRDFLYTRMRGYHAHPNATATSTSAIAPATAGAIPLESANAVKLLEGIHRELRLTRELIESRAQSKSPSA